MKSTRDHRANPNSTVASADRRGLLLKSAIAGAVVLALAGVQLAGPGGANATVPASALEVNTPSFGLASFANVAEHVTPAVVNVAVRGEVGAVKAGRDFQMPDFPQGSPFGEFFRRFFDEEALSPHGQVLPKRVQGQGSGFIIDPAGYIVTNNHVVDNAKEVTIVLNDGAEHPAEVKGIDPKTDLALLKIDAGKALPYVEFGDSDRTRVGDWVLAVGNPFGLGGTVTAGIVSARGRDIQSGPFDDYLQIDAPINRGNSGGPLFDASGRVIGVNTAIFSPSGGNVGIGFAIPASMAAPIIAQLREQGHIERGWLGVQIQAVTEEVAESLGLDAQQGTLVASVLADSPAAAAGLRPGDVILSVDGNAVEDFKTLPRLIADTEAGTRVVLQVMRQGQVENLPVILGLMPGTDQLAAAPAGDAKDASPRLGIYVAPLTPEVRQRHGLDEQARGVLVSEVEKDSPAARAGIKAGSLISMVGQDQVQAPQDLVAKVQEAIQQERSSVLLLVEQDGQKRFVAVRFAA